MACSMAVDVLEELSLDSSEELVQPRKPEKAKREKDRPKKEKPEKSRKEEPEKTKPEKKLKKPKKKPEQEKPEQETPKQETPEEENPEQEKPKMWRRSLHILHCQRIREDEHRAARPIRRRQIRRRQRQNSFAIYFSRVLKNVHVGLSLSQRSVSVLDSFVKDMFERITSEASFLVRRSRSSTINSREIQTAVRLLLTGELCKHAVTEGTMAMVRYISNN